MVSEENQELVVNRSTGGRGRYIVLFDPLDGSSNLDCNVPVGTVFGILAVRDPERPSELADVLQPGRALVAAGYVLYSSSTVLAYTTGAGVHMFTLEPAIGAYVLSNEHVVMPADSRIYSCNEGNAGGFPPAIQRYLSWAKTPAAGPYASRYIGSMVADFHRTLLKGGVFLYPGTARHPEGKLRLLYECNPMAFLAEQAGGVASDGHGRILDRRPTSLHERTPLYVGSKREVEQVLEFIRARV
jgi:fructose-1,6-bisphosphatase I